MGSPGIATAKEPIAPDATEKQAVSKDTTAPDSITVPRKQFDELVAKVGAMEAERSGDRTETATAAAIREGKLPPALRDWGLGYASKDPEGFRAYCSSAPALGDEIVAGPPARDGSGPDKSDNAIFLALGVSAESYAAASKQVAKQKAKEAGDGSVNS